jgi:DNA-binding MarR family transcriptional regulator
MWRPMKTTGPDSKTNSARAVSESVRGLHRIFQNVDLFSRKTLREFGVSGPQIWALRMIRDAECTTMTDLAHRLHLHPSTVSGIVDRLEERALASRHQAAGDARVTELRLTPSGRRMVSKVPEPPRSKVARGIGALSASELIHVQRAVQILSRIMDVPEPAGKEAEPHF